MLGSGDGGNIIKLRGLPFSTTTDDILQFLSGVNVLNGKEGVHLTEVRPGRPSGECFVEVESQKDVDNAMKKDKENMGKRYIEVFATDHHDMEWALNAMKQSKEEDIQFFNGDGGNIIKLRGLPFSTTTDDILQFLSGVNVLNGKEGVHLTEVRPGRPSGECFVEVESQDDVDNAMKKDKENMGKRYIEVFSTDRQDMEWALNAMKQSENGFESLPNVDDDMGVVKLRGLPFGCSKDEIIQFFNGIQVAPEGVHLLSDNTGRASGEAYVYFVDKQGAQDALSRDREKIGHRYIEVFLSSPDEVMSYAARMDNSVRSGRSYRPAPYDRNDRFGGRFPSRGGRSSFGRGGGGGYGGSRGSMRRNSGMHCVHMRGLPFKATPQDIAYFFKPIRPVNITILYDSSGRPSGEADIEFECHEDALRAMRRDKNNMDHRYIELFLNSAQGGGGGAFKSNRNFRNY